ncbi:MAG: monovalent cation/H+ antiporter subunit D family protein [Planctomycetes bacterium]|nr:monovalent cation/H+ antiporter subunit D family protein [Planctomycetota bacterium]
MSPLIPLLIPLVGAFGIALTGRWPNVREGVTLVTGVALLIAVLMMAPAIMDPTLPNPSWEGPELVLGLKISFQLEPLGLLYALVGAALWIPNSIYSIGYMRGHHEKNQTRFYVCFALALTSVMGIAFSGNLFTLFTFYEALSIVTFPLVTHHGSPEAKRSGRIYVGILFGTSMAFFLAAILGTYVLTDGDMTFRAGGILMDVAPMAVGVLYVLFMLGIGKAALMPFHWWLPAAMVAPTPVSALLHAVAVVKAGVFCVLKISVYVFGIDLIASDATGSWLIYLASFTVLTASVVALYQDNLKARLAYSTIGQLGYIVLGAALGTTLGIVGGGVHVAMHAFGKITLFFCAGAIYVATGKTKVSQLTGLGRQMPITFLAFGIASLSIIGLPPLGGAWSKWYLGLGALASDHPFVLAVFLISSLLNVAYLLPISVRAFFLAPEDGKKRGFDEAPVACLIALSATAIGSIVLFFYPGPLVALMEMVVAQ